MSKSFIENEVVLREYPNQISPSQLNQSPKLHQCALIWSDKCAHCEIAFDELNKKLSSSTQPNKETLNELGKQIGDSLATLEGSLIAFLIGIGII